MSGSGDEGGSAPGGGSRGRFGGRTGGGKGSGTRHAETARLLWGGPRSLPARGPRPTLDLGRVARAGVELADAEGMSAVSMHRVAARLGVTKMALYRYVPGKAELVALMVDDAMGPYPEQRQQGQGRRDGWRGRLAAWAEELLTAYLRHPWVLDATAGPRVVGPSELDWIEHAVAALDGTRLSGAERMDAAVLLGSHVRGIAQQARATSPGESQEGELSVVLSEVLKERGERYPALAAALASTAAEPEGRDQAWEFGLQRILDGLAVLVEERAR
ncbi:TetR/AcrR family transcriptional regulator [Streptomyces winkii]|uniref:TetR/AcrR family transcriptional regulator n=1 Tax=Streptomyces winkii TaxID=3051178 RepID=UPI0028D4850F|nr:TetR/AcrR family transcriptional regulator [Streptomyces sp. DSM 40971]